MDVNFDLPALLVDADELSLLASARLAVSVESEDREYFERQLRLAAFARSVADPTPLSFDDASIAFFQTFPEVNGQSPWTYSVDGWYWSNDNDTVTFGPNPTRGRVRLFAAAMGLQLREGNE